MNTLFMPVIHYWKQRQRKMRLAIDIGNSNFKTAAIERSAGDDETVVAACSTTWSKTWATQLQTDLRTYRPTRIGIASVVPARYTEVQTLVRQGTHAPIFVVRHGIMLPFELAYRTPDTLGADRLAAAAAAWHYYGRGQPTIVVDAGTALTIDVIHHGTYLGGMIGAGPALEAWALARGTDTLPRIRTGLAVPATVGKSTRESVQTGVFFGLIDRVRGHVDRLSASLGSQRIVVITGGWHALLHKHFDGADHVDPHLVVRGIGLLMTLNPA